jgi:hypothetical protein
MLLCRLLTNQDVGLNHAFPGKRLPLIRWRILESAFGGFSWPGHKLRALFGANLWLKQRESKLMSILNRHLIHPSDCKGHP